MLLYNLLFTIDLYIVVVIGNDYGQVIFRAAQQGSIAHIFICPDSCLKVIDPAERSVFSSFEVGSGPSVKTAGFNFHIILVSSHKYILHSVLVKIIYQYTIDRRYLCLNRQCVECKVPLFIFPPSCLQHCTGKDQR